MYTHYAERNVAGNHNNSELRQLDDITENGIKETKLLAKRLENQNITTIVTSPYL